MPNGDAIQGELFATCTKGHLTFISVYWMANPIQRCVEFEIN